MAVEAYAIGVSLVMDQSKVLGPLGEMMRALDRVQQALQRTQTGMNEMVSSLRGATRVTIALAAAMERVATAAGKAAKAGAPSGGSAGPRAPSVAATAAGATAAISGGGGRALIPYAGGGALTPYRSGETRGTTVGLPYSPHGTYGRAPRQTPFGGLLTFDPNVPKAGDGFTMSGPPMSTGTGFQMIGGAAPPSAPPGWQWHPNFGNGAGGAATPPADGGGGSGGGLVPSGAGPLGAPNGPGPRGPINLPPLPPMPGANPPINWPTRQGLMHNGAEAGILAFGGYEMAKHIMDPAMEAESIVAQMRASRFTDDQVTRSKALAYGMVKSVPGQTYAQGLELINQTTAFTGNADEAMALTPGLARNARVLSLYGKGDAIGQVEAGVKAGELTGLTNKDGTMNVPKLTEFVTRLTGTVVSGGGTLNIGKYLTGIRQFGVGADSATMDFTTAVLPAYMKIMGEAKSGTALASFQQSLGSTAPRTQNKSITAEQKRLGLRDSKGELINGELLRTDPNAYIGQQLLPSVARDLTTRGKEVTPQEIQAELSKILPRQTMIRLAAAGIFDAAVVTKEADRNRAQQTAQVSAEKAGTAGPLDKLLTDSPANQMAAFTAALGLFETKLGDAVLKPAIGALGDLTGVLQRMADWASAHPDATKIALEGVAAGLVVLGTAATVGALALLAGPAGLLAGVAAGVVAVAKGMETLDQKIKSLIPSFANNNGPSLYEPSKHGALSNWWNDPIPWLHGRQYPTPDATVQKQSYAVPPKDTRPIVIHAAFVTDGEVHARQVIRVMDRDARSGAQQGMTGHDSSETPFLSGGMVAL